MINRVWVEEYGTNKIDIVLSVKEPANEYWPVRDEVKKSIHNLAKMAGVKTRFNIYP
jgi:small-conductance mechanosensitive channel